MAAFRMDDLESVTAGWIRQCLICMTSGRSSWWLCPCLRTRICGLKTLSFIHMYAWHELVSTYARAASRRM